MGLRHQILYFLPLLLAIGCAKRIPISYDRVQPNALVKVEKLSGQVYQGEIQQKSIDYLLLKEDRYHDRLTRINREDIASITGREFVEDGIGGFISEWEIREHQKNRNLWLYTIGGGSLSFGASFFIGSLLHRGLDDEKNGTKILWGTTGLGTITGTLLFARVGRKRDRLFAIEKLREQRYEIAKKQYHNHKIKHETVQQQLERERAERARQEQELRLLKEKIKNKKKK